MSSVDELTIWDRGLGATAFARIVGPLIRSLPNAHTLFAQRVGFSDRFLYRHLVPRLLEQGAGPILLPLRHLLETNLDPTVLYQGVSLQAGALAPGRIYQFNSHDIHETVELLDGLHRSMVSQLPPRARTILLVDSLEPLGNALEVVIRRFMQEGMTLKVTVWLHHPLPLMSHDLLGQMSNVFVFLPSRQDVQILRDVLPLPARDLDVESLRQHLLLYGHVGEPASWVTYGPLGAPQSPVPSQESED